MSHWERPGQSDEWYTPKYVFDALGCTFDQDVAAPLFGPKYVPTGEWLHTQSLESRWYGFVWMNPPFGGRNGLVPWLDKFFVHGNGVALVPDRTSAPWWQAAARKSDALLFVSPKIKFEKPDGTTGDSPGTGTCLMAAGGRGVQALNRAAGKGLGVLAKSQVAIYA